MEKTEATFNEIPQALDSILVRMEKLEGMISDIHSIHKRQTEAATPPPDLHVPMNIDDMVAFSRMKKSTVYYHIDNNGLPCVKVGKNITFFKDEVVVWLESYRKGIPFEKMNDEIMASHRRKPNKSRLSI